MEEVIALIPTHSGVEHDRRAARDKVLIELDVVLASDKRKSLSQLQQKVTKIQP
jgi:hypothetical protein